MKEFNLTVSRMYSTRNGNMRTVTLEDDELEALQQVRKGGMLLVKNLPADRRKTDKSPHAFLEYIKPEDVEAFFGGPKTGRPTPKTTVDTSTDSETF